MAGLNPTNAGGVGVTLADAHTLSFSMDFTGGIDDGKDNDDDGIVDEGVNGKDDNDDNPDDPPEGALDLVDEADEAEWYDGDVDDPNEQVIYVLSNDADNDGINDGGVCNLLRNGEVLAPNIDALNFVYLDSAGNPLATPVADPSGIRSIQVSLVARSGEKPSKYSYGYVDGKSYQNQQGAVILPQQNDSFRRVSMTMEAKCRNLGL